MDCCIKYLSPLPIWGLNFSSYHWRLAKIAFTPEDFHEKCGLTPEEYGFMPEEFREN